MILPNLPLMVKRTMSSLFSGMKITEGGEDVALYDQLMAYYLQNGLYDSIMSASFYLDKWHESMKPLRNPANRSVEFFASKLIPGTLPDSLPIVTDNEAIIEPIHKVWKWTNLNQQKPYVIRSFAIFGDLFIHPVSNPEQTKVYHQFVDPRMVTDFEADDRGSVQSIRIDSTINDDLGNKYHTEYWDKYGVFIWEHQFGPKTPLDQLGDPILVESLDAFGIDFVPFVHSKFRDVGYKRGVGAFSHCLDKIDEANRQATRLHELLFQNNKPIWAAMANQVDPSGRPLPAPRVGGDDETKLSLEDNSIIRMPGNSTLQTLIPDIRYADALMILQDMMHEIEKDLPELAYFSLREKGELSGRAVRLLLGDAIDRANEARSNLEGALIKAENMALTMGQYLGLWNGIGTFENDDFEHSYAVREILEAGTFEKAETLEKLIAGGLSGEGALRLAGFTDDEIKQADLQTVQPPTLPNPVVENTNLPTEMPVGGSMMDNEI